MKFLTFLLATILLLGCESSIKNKMKNESPEIINNLTKLENGIYLLKDLAVSLNKLSANESETIIETNNLFEHNATDSIKFYLIEKEEFVPMKITEKPVISANPNPKIEGDTTRLSQLKITLLPKYAKLLEEFTTKHVNKKITIVIGGKAITKHLIREPITGGNIQISRCTDEACTVLLSEIVNN